MYSAFIHNKISLSGMVKMYSFLCLLEVASLCVTYQLPTLITSRKICSVTIFISLLLSLMEDQVQAFLINSECDQEQRQMIFSALNEPRVE